MPISAASDGLEESCDVCGGLGEVEVEEFSDPAGRSYADCPNSCPKPPRRLTRALIAGLVADAKAQAETAAWRRSVRSGKDGAA